MGSQQQILYQVVERQDHSQYEVFIGIASVVVYIVKVKTSLVD